MREMDSAPRDGSKFLGRVGEDLISMFWHEGFGEFVSSFNRMTLAPGMTFDDTGLNYRDHSPQIQRPTAWMPSLNKIEPQETDHAD